jgi:hypothetical protein
MELMKNLDTLDERSRMELLSQVDQQRQELLLLLLKHLDTSSSINVKAAGIYLMGRHRLSDGVEELIRRIDFDAGENLLFGALPLWDRYPAMEALIHIGQPAVPAAVELLAADMNDLRRDLAVKVVRYVEDGDVAGFILNRAHAAETDPNRKANLQDAIDRLAKLPR